jgi:CubicO group peptidase (beta-lactamase class C family)
MTAAVSQITPNAAEHPLDSGKLTRLENQLTKLQKKYNIPGMSGAVAEGQEVIWVKAFGKADQERGIRVDTNTVFHLASLTKPFAAAILLQLVESGKLDLDTPVTQFGIEFENSRAITVRHVLSHTSEGKPGTAYKYSGARFRQMDKVIEKLTGHSFAAEVGTRILEPLNLMDISPNPEVPDACRAAGRSPEKFTPRLAKGYQPDGKTPQTYPKGVSSSAGLVATAADVARFSIAWDENRLLKSETKALAYTPARGKKGTSLAYGLGWFVFEKNRQKIIWHYGWWDGISALIVKLPERSLTFVLLANSDMLSRPFNLGGDSNVYRSAFASSFLKTLE